MAYFLGRDVEVAITTEHDDAQHSGQTNSGINSSVAVATSSMVIPNREVAHCSMKVKQQIPSKM